MCYGSETAVSLPKLYSRTWYDPRKTGDENDELVDVRNAEGSIGFETVMTLPWVPLDTAAGPIAENMELDPWSQDYVLKLGVRDPSGTDLNLDLAL